MPPSSPSEGRPDPEEEESEPEDEPPSDGRSGRPPEGMGNEGEPLSPPWPPRIPESPPVGSAAPDGRMPLPMPDAPSPSSRPLSKPESPVGSAPSGGKTPAENDGRPLPEGRSGMPEGKPERPDGKLGRSEGKPDRPEGRFGRPEGRLGRPEGKLGRLPSAPPLLPPPRSGRDGSDEPLSDELPEPEPESEPRFRLSFNGAAPALNAKLNKAVFDVKCIANRRLTPDIGIVTTVVNEKAVRSTAATKKGIESSERKDDEATDERGNRPS